MNYLRLKALARSALANYLTGLERPKTIDQVDWSALQHGEAQWISWDTFGQLLDAFPSAMADFCFALGGHVEIIKNGKADPYLEYVLGRAPDPRD